MPSNRRRPLHLKFPKVGMRVVKTVIVATMVSVIYGLSGRNPCFACIGAVFGMGSAVRDGLKFGGNRFIGTFIGGLLAIPFYWLIHLSGWPIPKWVWISIGLFLVLYISQIFDAHGAIHPGSVVFFVVIDTIIPERYISYTIARIIDTGIGVAVALAVNALFPNKKKVQDPDPAKAVTSSPETIEVRPAATARNEGLELC